MTSIAWTVDTDLSFQPQSASAMESAEEVKWREIGGEINGFRSCRNNWDGLGASAPNPDIIDRAIAFIELARELFSDRAPTFGNLRTLSPSQIFSVSLDPKLTIILPPYVTNVKSK